MKTVFLLSGFNLVGSAATNEKYTNCIEDIEAKGYQVVPVDIQWKHMTPTQFVQFFIEKYTPHKTEENTIIGNSAGALVSVLAAPEFKPNRLILCSLSPFFTETLQDQQFFDFLVKHFGKRRLDDMKNYSILKQAQAINTLSCKVDFLYGEKEKKQYPWLVDFSRKYSQYFDDAKLRQVAGAPHELSSRIYQKAVLDLL